MWTSAVRDEISEIRTTPLSETLKGLIIGTVLGDGCLQQLRNQEFAYLKVGQHLLSFVEHKRQLLKPLIKEGTEIRRWVHDGHESYHFNTVAHPDLYQLRQQFYEGGRKTVTVDLMKALTVAGFALWYLDDGYRNKKGQYFLSTCNFSLDEHHLIREWLFRKFRLKTSILRNQQYFKLYFAKGSQSQLEYLLRPFIPLCMQYKFTQESNSSETER